MSPSLLLPMSLVCGNILSGIQCFNHNLVSSIGPHLLKQEALRDNKFQYESECQSVSVDQTVISSTVDITQPSVSSSWDYILANRRAVITVAALITLVLQNSGLTILMRLSRLSSTSSIKKQMYFGSSAVVLCELIKLFAYSTIYLTTECNSNASQFIVNVGKDMKQQGSRVFHVFVPSALYVIQNNLQYRASSNLPAQVYQVLMQLKIITTAIFSVFILGKRPSITQWGCIFSLFLGLLIVQTSFQSTASMVMANVNPVIGITSVLLTCLTSGLAGVFWEKLSKEPNANLWLRNIQMSLISLVLGLGMCMKDLEGIRTHGFFVGFNSLVVTVVAFQASGGLIIPIVVKYTDSIVKGFATSASIVLSFIISKYLFQDTKLNAMFVLGAGVVTASGVFYSNPQVIDNFIAKNLPSKLLTHKN